MLLTTAYFPPVCYFAKIAEGFTLSPEEATPAVVHIEACENYQKQSYRNRCRIYAGDGVQDLSVPIVHTGGTISIPIGEVKVDWSTPWMTRTQRAIASAYESSPYFDFYRDELFSILDRRQERLIDLNTDILRFFLDKTGIKAEIRFTESFTAPGADTYGEDLREVIHPKRANTILKDMGLEKPHYQVFACKWGFKPDLSVMDLLFNEGPDSILYLKRR